MKKLILVEGEIIIGTDVKSVYSNIFHIVGYEIIVMIHLIGPSSHRDLYFRFLKRGLMS